MHCWVNLPWMEIAELSFGHFFCRAGLHRWGPVCLPSPPSQSAPPCPPRTQWAWGMLGAPASCLPSCPVHPAAAVRPSERRCLAAGSSGICHVMAKDRDYQDTAMLLFCMVSQPSIMPVQGPCILCYSGSSRHAGWRCTILNALSDLTVLTLTLLQLDRRLPST